MKSTNTTTNDERGVERESVVDLHLHNFMISFLMAALESKICIPANGVQLNAYRYFTICTK